MSNMTNRIATFQGERNALRDAAKERLALLRQYKAYYEAELTADEAESQAILKEFGIDFGEAPLPSQISFREWSERAFEFVRSRCGNWISSATIKEYLTDCPYIPSKLLADYIKDGRIEAKRQLYTYVMPKPQEPADAND